MATTGQQLKSCMKEKIMSEQDYKSVLDVLSQYESMPFLEISALVDIPDERLIQIVDDLELKGIVKITSRDNILEEIVTLKDNSFALVSSVP